jgi:hypothetical protein
MADLHEGVCAGCEQEVMVAACCAKHLIPICRGCYEAIGRMQKKAGVEGCHAPVALHPSNRDKMEVGGREGEGKEGEDMQTLPVDDTPPPMPHFEHSYLNVDEDITNTIPQQEVVELMIGSVLMPRHEGVKEEDGEVVAQVVDGVEYVQGAFVKVTLRTDHLCPGYGDNHPPHVEHMLAEGGMIVGVDMMKAMIQGFADVLEGRVEEKAERWMEEGIRGLLGKDEGNEE